MFSLQIRFIPVIINVVIDMEKESKTLEFKEDKTKTYLKTVSAFANFGAGEIRFGVNDDGEVEPISDPRAFVLEIENQINDSIKPQPFYNIVLNPNKTVSIFVEKGSNTPYLYNGKAYKRNHTSTVEADLVELKRLILAGNNQTFDQVECGVENLTFSSLEEQLRKRIGIRKVDESVLKTLGLLTEKGFNNAALLFSEQNALNGIDIVVFGKNINIFKERYDLSHFSIIQQFEKTIEVFDRVYVEEQVTARGRNIIERIPFIAFKEILSNAIVHRAYDVQANTKIEMWEDHITISSPGGLPSNITFEQFKSGSFSIARNPIIASTMNRIGLIEMFATGIKRTNESYFNFDVKPRYEIIGDSVKVTLPCTTGELMFAESDDYDFLMLLNSNVLYTREQLEQISGYNKTKLIRMLNRLISKGLLQRVGQGKRTFYRK